MSTKKLKVVNVDSKNVVIITPEFRRMIDTLHTKVGHIEWSGFMYYSVSGEIGKQTFTPKYIFLQDIGSASYTEYTTNPADFAEFISRNPEVETLLCGKIHTHHNLTMGTAFSGTDDDDLQECCEMYCQTGYLSLIVHETSTYSAKIGYAVKKSTAYDLLRTHSKDDNPQIFLEEENMCLAVKCAVQEKAVNKTADPEMEFWYDKISARKRTAVARSYGGGNSVNRIVSTETYADVINLVNPAIEHNETHFRVYGIKNWFNKTTSKEESYQFLPTPPILTDPYYLTEENKASIKEGYRLRKFIEHEAPKKEKGSRSSPGMLVLMEALEYYFMNQKFVFRIPSKPGYIRFAAAYDKEFTENDFSVKDFSNCLLSHIFLDAAADTPNMVADFDIANIVDDIYLFFSESFEASQKRLTLFVLKAIQEQQKLWGMYTTKAPIPSGLTAYNRWNYYNMYGSDFPLSYETYKKRIGKNGTKINA